MTKLLILASLLACAAPAVAAPPLVKAAACAESGAPIFQATKGTKDGTGPSTVDAIWDTGAWRHQDLDGKRVTKAVGGQCLSAAQLASAKAALADATWTVTVARIKCMARSNALETYAAGGKDVFSTSLCDGKKLDDKSAAALATLTEILKGPAAAPASGK